MDILTQPTPIAATMPAFLVRGADGWTKRPGNFDALHTAELFASDNTLGLPLIGNRGPVRPARLHPYNIRTRSADSLANSAVHFYLDDYQFEITWSRPKRALSYAKRFSAALTPDFSIWSHWPLAAQQWNTYRNRWVGAFWMSCGLTVIPSVSWAGPESFDFAFAGIKTGSTIAVSTVGLKSSLSKGHFINGFMELLERVKPCLILSYGRLPIGCPVEVIEYPTYWEERKSATA